MSSELSRLSQLLGPAIAIFVGGRGTSSYRDFLSEAGARYLPDIQSLRHELESLRLSDTVK
jgi:hypothetical protein